MAMFGKAGNAVLNQVLAGLTGIDFAAQKRREQQKEAIQQAQQMAAGLLRPAPGAMRQAPIGNDDGEDITAAFAPQMEQGPSRPRSPQEVAAGLADITAKTPGFNPKTYVGLAQYSKPSIRYDRGQGYDDATGAPTGDYHPDLDKGQEPLYDRAGRLAGVRNIDGSVRSAAEMAGAVEAAKAAAQAPYQRVEATDENGRPVVTNAIDLAHRAAPFVGQSPAEAAGAKAQAEAAAARINDLRSAVAADAKVTPLLDRMDALIKGGNIVTGFGADIRLNGDRALAAVGNADAAKRVTDTQTYQNLTSRQVLPLVKALGSGNGITDADRKFTQAIVAGDIALDEETIKRVIAIGRDQVKANAEALRQATQGGSAPATPRPGAAPRTSMGRSRIISVQ